MTSRETVDLTVLVPTIGRPDPLARCLTSITACRPAAREIVVVDQSRSGTIADVVSAFAEHGARRVPCAGRGVALAINHGLREASHVVVAKTDDDCVVAPDWVATAWRDMDVDDQRVLTGRSLPPGDRRHTPSLREDPVPRDYHGDVRHDVLGGNNMVLNRDLVLAAGGFDESFPFAAEDVEFCYRWLKAGRRLTYDPALVVWHHDARTPRELEELYVSYWRGAGRFYGKQLASGDLRVGRLLATDLKSAARAFASGVLRGTPRWTDDNRGALRGLWPGLLDGWRTARARPA